MIERDPWKAYQLGNSLMKPLFAGINLIIVRRVDWTYGKPQMREQNKKLL
jgi:hypothetical protein